MSLSPWCQQKHDLSEWVLANLANRVDARGGYWADGGAVNRTTRKQGDKYWRPLDAALRDHFTATKPEHIIGLHSTSPDNTSRWLGIDIDAHTERDEADLNIKAMVEILERLEVLGFTGHAFSSDGRGGIHIWVLMAEPAATDRVFELGRQVTQGIRCETFPKQATVPDGKYGNWLRIPGRHHSRDHWSQIWTGDGWGTPEATVNAILSMEGNDVALLPAAKKTNKVSVPVGVLDGVKLKLRTRTLEILNDGVDEGDRNNALAAAAIEMAGNGYGREETEERILLAARRCRPPLEEREAMAIVASAYSQPRTPWVDGRLPADGPGVDRVKNEVYEPQTPVSSETTDVSDSDGAQPQFRPTITNHIVGSGGEDEIKMFALTIDEITEKLLKGTGGWPRKVSSSLFVVQPDPIGKDGLPVARAVRTLGDTGKLFAWMQQRCDLHWPTTFRKGCWSRTSREAATPVNRLEFFEHLDATIDQTYESVEFLPHFPECPRSYYLPCKLPAPTGAALEEMMGRFNAESDEDRLLMVAALVTGCWGGPPGKRPAFVFESEYGLGTGKSQTAIRIMQIYGDSSWITLSPDKEDWREAKSRMMDDSALSCRFLFIDNLKTKLTGGEIESILTAPKIDAKKMYHGQYSRPNRMTLFITSNTPRLSADLTNRSVPIRLGDRKHSADWEVWAERFINDNRAQVIADIIGFLKSDPMCEIAKENVDRWKMWQDAILTRFKQGNELAAYIKTRRPQNDADRDEAEEVLDAIEFEVRACCMSGCNFFISSESMLNILQKHKIVDGRFTKRAATTMIGNMIGPHTPLKNLHRDRIGKTGARGWVFLATGKREGVEVQPLVVTD